MIKNSGLYRGGDRNALRRKKRGSESEKVTEHKRESEPERESQRGRAREGQPERDRASSLGSPPRGRAREHRNMVSETHRCRVDMAHITQSRPDSGFGFQVKLLKDGNVVRSSLESGGAQRSKCHGATLESSWGQILGQSPTDTASPRWHLCGH